MAASVVVTVIDLPDFCTLGGSHQKKKMVALSRALPSAVVAAVTAESLRPPSAEAAPQIVLSSLP